LEGHHIGVCTEAVRRHSRLGLVYLACGLVSVELAVLPLEAVRLRLRYWWRSGLPMSPRQTTVGVLIGVSILVGAAWLAVGPRSITYAAQPAGGCTDQGPLHVAGYYWYPYWYAKGPQPADPPAYSAIEVSYGWFHKMSSTGVLIGTDGSRTKAGGGRNWELTCVGSSGS